MTKLKFMAAVVALGLCVSGCVKERYVGLYINPISELYQNLGAANDRQAITQTDENFSFVYTITKKEGNIYHIEGVATPLFHQLRYDQIDLHLMLIGNLRIVRYIRVPALYSSMNSEFKFSKDFEVTEPFTQSYLDYQVKYSF